MPLYDIRKRSIECAKFRVKFKDIFDMKEFYKALHQWLKEYNWVDYEEGTEHYETLYLEKIDMGGVKELWIRWRPQKIPTGNSYYKYHLDFDFHCVGLKPTQVVREGKKFDVDKGEVELWITANIEFDVEGKWSHHPILRFFHQLFPKRIFRKDLFEEHKKELYREAYILQNFTKQWFKLKRFLPYEEVAPFFPSLAWPTHMPEK